MNSLTLLLQNSDIKSIKIFFKTSNNIFKDYTKTQLIDYLSFLCKNKPLNDVKYFIKIIISNINIDEISTVGLKLSIQSEDVNKINYFLNNLEITYNIDDDDIINISKLYCITTVESILKKCKITNDIIKNLFVKYVCLNKSNFIKLMIDKYANIIDNDIVQQAIFNCDYKIVRFLLKHVNIDNYKLDLSSSEMNIITLISNITNNIICLDLKTVLSCGKLNNNQIKLLYKNNILFNNLDPAFIYSLWQSSIIGIKISIYLGCDIHIMDDIAIKIAASKGNLEIIKLLVNKGINPDNRFAKLISKKNNHYDIYHFLINDTINLYDNSTSDYKYYSTKDFIYNKIFKCLNIFGIST